MVLPKKLNRPILAAEFANAWFLKLLEKNICKYLRYIPKARRNIYNLKASTDDLKEKNFFQE